MADAYGFVPITKQEKTDDGTLIVAGPATDSSLDRDYQIADPAWLDKAMPQWFTDGGGVREQHDAKKAVGVAVTYQKRDDGQHWIEAEIVDPITIKKIEKNVLRGFSFGAKGARVTTDKAAAGGRIVDGTIYEVSVVDRPANPQCMFTIAKADGGGDLQLVEEPELVEKEEKYTPSDFAEILKRKFTKDERDDAADKGQALPDGSFPIKTKADLANAIKAFGRAKDPKATKAHIIKRARALGAIDALPDSWGISKADQIVADVRAALPELVVTKDDGSAYDPATEAGDIDNAMAAISCIARLIISEAEGLAAGRMEEIWDIQTLASAASGLQYFVQCESNQEVELSMSDTKADKADKVEAGQPAATDADPKTTDGDQLSKTELSDLLQDAITKAVKPLQDELALVKGDMAKVLETPVAGGPARLRTTTQSAVASKADGLRREIDLCQKSIQITGGELQQGYRERLAIAEGELSKLDG
jgi:hypothetical protein